MHLLVIHYVEKYSFMDKYRKYKVICVYNISNEMTLELQTSSYGTLLTYSAAHLNTLHLIAHDVFQLKRKYFQFSIPTTNTVLFTKHVCPYLKASVAQII